MNHSQIFANTLDELHAAMEACEQTKGMNMLQHGQMVHAHYLTLIDELKHGNADSSELLNIWQRFNRDLPDAPTLQAYHTYHDCAKHLCLITDESGKRHFPNHAEMSSKQYRHLFPGDEMTAYLIQHDMDFRLAKSSDSLTIWAQPYSHILFLTAWAEINANAEMFGGRHSESYKIKRSRLIQHAKKLIKNCPS